MIFSKYHRFIVTFLEIKKQREARSVHSLSLLIIKFLNQSKKHPGELIQH
jgi:hypothetical protein